MCLLVGFQKMKIYSKRKQLDTSVIKNAFRLGERVKVKFLTEAWNKLHTNYMVSKSNFIHMIEMARASLFSRCLKKIYFKNKGIAWHKLN